MLQDFDSQEGEHLSETILRQFVNGHLANNATVQVESHLASCSQCQARLDDIIGEVGVTKPALRSLTQAFARKGVPSPVPGLAPTPQIQPDFETIAAYVDGILAPEQATEFEVRMRQMPQLAQQVAELRTLKERLQAPSALQRTDAAANATSDAVPSPVVKERKTLVPSTKTWWASWRWPVQSLGVATAMSLLLFLVATKPWQHTLQNTLGQSTPAPVAPTKRPSSGEEVMRGGSSGTEATIKQYDVQKRLLAISNSRSESQALLRLVKIVPYKVKGNFDSEKNWRSSQAPDASQPLALSQRLEFKVGEGIRFRFENQSSKTLYLVLLWLAQDGSVTPLTRPRPNNSPVIELTPRGTSRAKVATRNYEIRPPAAVENIKLFVSTRPLNPDHLNFDNKVKGASQAAKPSSPLEMVLRQTLGTSVSSNSSGFNTWGTTNFPIRIRQK